VDMETCDQIHDSLRNDVDWRGLGNHLEKLRVRLDAAVEEQRRVQIIRFGRKQDGQDNFSFGDKQPIAADKIALPDLPVWLKPRIIRVGNADDQNVSRKPDRLFGDIDPAQRFNNLSGIAGDRFVEDGLALPACRNNAGSAQFRQML
jgi:hypothetical protein